MEAEDELVVCLPMAGACIVYQYLATLPMDMISTLSLTNKPSQHERNSGFRRGVIEWAPALIDLACGIAL
jgi:hypothetical protein